MLRYVFGMTGGRLASRAGAITRAVQRVGLAAGLSLASLVSQPATAQTVYSVEVKKTCSGGGCIAIFRFPLRTTVIIERVSCRIDLRGPGSKLKRVVLVSEKASGQGDFERQDLAFEKTFTDEARQIFVVATNPFFQITPNLTGRIVVTAESSSGSIECYVAGHKSN